MNVVSVCPTVADSKRSFHQAFPFVIAPLYRRMVDELLVELHLLSRHEGFHADSLFAVGLTQVFDAFSKGYRPDHHRQPLFSALCRANGLDPDGLRRMRDDALQVVGHHQIEEVSGWVANAGDGAPDLLRDALQAARAPGFHYSRLMAVGLLSLLEGARGADALDPQALRSRAHDMAESMGLMRDRVDKDLALYTTNLEKMAQAVELMEETVAADRRRRERQERSAGPQGDAGSDAGSGTGSGPGAGDGAATAGSAAAGGTTSQPLSS
ncbi:photosystem II biogenesis protein Psp29 [Synechococcus sp. RSCCF101]|uniref:photosystem II biogenesis protein Psp29 n=1 Tax=Synechococcus sp. RSCCF101 TaxID=2511069 RepID=UPI001247B56B|nr:photosystem II biogenesis protein Psp29 [Synechococcus sp. RSCCF101]